MAVPAGTTFRRARPPLSVRGRAVYPILIMFAVLAGIAAVVGLAGRRWLR
jgi:hypothetical protein